MTMHAAKSQPLCYPSGLSRATSMYRIKPRRGPREARRDRPLRHSSSFDVACCGDRVFAAFLHRPAVTYLTKMVFTSPSVLRLRGRAKSWVSDFNDRGSTMTAAEEKGLHLRLPRREQKRPTELSAWRAFC